MLLWFAKDNLFELSCFWSSWSQCYTYRCFCARHIHYLRQFFSGQWFTVTLNSDGLGDNLSRSRCMTYNMRSFGRLRDWGRVNLESSCYDHRITYSREKLYKMLKVLCRGKFPAKLWIFIQDRTGK